MKIIVGFSTPKKFNLFSWLIKKVGKSDFSHAYISYWDKEAERWVVYQASGLKVNFESLINFRKREIRVAEFEVPVSEKTFKKIRGFAIDNVGAGYAVLKILGFPWVLLCRSLGKKVKNPFTEKGTFFCSDLDTVILEEIVKDGDTLDPDTEMPVDLYNFMVQKGYKRS